MIKAIIFDYGHTLWNHAAEGFYPEAFNVLEQLTKLPIKLALVSRTYDPDKRKSQIEKFKIGRYFEMIEIIPYGDLKEGNTKNFIPALDKMGVKPNECLVIGDRVTSEIRVGNAIGAITVRVVQGKFKDEVPSLESDVPIYTIRSLGEVVPLVEKLIQHT